MHDRARGATRSGRELVVAGAVQGVGFRPFVLREARALGLDGDVGNDERGVVVRAFGDSAALDELARRIASAPPPSAIVRTVESRAIEVERGAPRGFHIAAPAPSGARRVSIGPDLATCDACAAEVDDPSARRFRHPFANCTACGPRYTIARELPYERHKTTMATFAMCAACRAEYEDPGDRRFHAQPIACPDCGPTLAWHAADGALVARGNALALEGAVRALQGGAIVAVLGLGGFHLMVRADDARAVRELRARKRRGDKPFAVLCADVDMARACLVDSARLDAAETRALRSPAAPIVLVRAAADARRIAEGVAPGSPDLGLFLAPTPLHRMLVRDVGAPLVATSGNRSEEPLATTLEDALERLAGIADHFLVHDRPIARSVDDSVVRVVEGSTMVLRRARGYAPLWLALPPTGGAPGSVDLALGAHQKATVGLSSGGDAILSPHVGDLGTDAARALHRRSVADLQRLVGRTPDRVVCDLHPDYASTILAEELAAAQGGPRLVRVQHHVAHAAAALAECLDAPGDDAHGSSDAARDAWIVTWDGSGAGNDGTLFGGEVFTRRAGVLRRCATFAPFALPGGERAGREPWRVAAGLLESTFGSDVPAALGEALVRAAEGAGQAGALALVRSVARTDLAPRTSSVGRLFDAVAALLGLSSVQSFEADAALRLEAAAVAASEPAAPLPMRFVERDGLLVVEHGPWLRALSEDLAAGVPVSALAARFHSGLAALVGQLARRDRALPVLLTGGCMQNRLLLEACARAARAEGADVRWPRAVPVGDGGIAFGQLAAVRTNASLGTAEPLSSKGGGPSGSVAPPVSRQPKSVPCASPSPERSST